MLEDMATWLLENGRHVTRLELASHPPGAHWEGSGGRSVLSGAGLACREAASLHWSATPREDSHGSLSFYSNLMHGGLAPSGPKKRSNA